MGMRKDASVVSKIEQAEGHGDIEQDKERC